MKTFTVTVKAEDSESLAVLLDLAREVADSDREFIDGLEIGDSMDLDGDAVVLKRVRQR